METTPETALKVLTALLTRTPLNEAEALGAQVAVSVLEKTNKELRDFKTTPIPPQN